MNECRRTLTVCLLTVPVCVRVSAQQTNGLTIDIITERPASEGDFRLVGTDREAALLRYDAKDFKGVIRAIGDLRTYIGSVTGVTPEMAAASSSSRYELLIGTVGHSEVIDWLVSSGKLEVKELQGKWESFIITTLRNPSPGYKECWLSQAATSEARSTASTNYRGSLESRQTIEYK